MMSDDVWRYLLKLEGPTQEELNEIANETSSGFLAIESEDKEE